MCKQFFFPVNLENGMLVFLIKMGVGENLRARVEALGGARGGERRAGHNEQSLQKYAKKKI